MARTAGELVALASALVATSGLAELLGAANMGSALTFGTLAFTGALLWVVLRG